MNRFFTCLAALGIVLLYACGKPVSKQIKLIPKNAASVVGLNLPLIKDSLQQSGIAFDSIVAQINKATIGNKVAGFDLVKYSSIDINQPVYGFTVNKVAKETGLNIGFTSLVGSLINEKQIDTLFSKINAGGTTQKGDGFQYRKLNDDIYVSWNKETVIYTYFKIGFPPVIDTSKLNTANLDSLKVDSTIFTKKKETASDSALMRTAIKDVEETIAYWYNLEDYQRMVAVKSFKKTVEKGAHIFSWTNTEQLFPMLAQIPLSGVSEIFSGNYLAASLFFERGQVKTDVDMYYNNAINAIFKEYPSDKADLDLVTNYPSQNINACFVSSFNPKVLPVFAGNFSLGAIAAAMLPKKLGFDLDDLSHAFKGQIAFVLSDFTLVKKDTGANAGNQVLSMLNLKPSFSFLVNIPIGDPAYANKLLGVFGNKKLDSLKQSLRESGMILTTNDKNWILTNDVTKLEAYLQPGKKAAIPQEMLDKFKDKGTVGYADISRTIQSLPFKEIPSVDSFITNTSSIFKRAALTFDGVKGDDMHGSLELQLANNQKNSLAFFVDLVTHGAEQYKVVSQSVQNSDADMMIPAHKGLLLDGY